MERLINSAPDDEVPKLVQFDDDDVHPKQTTLRIRTTRRRLQGSDPEVAIAAAHSPPAADPLTTDKSADFNGDNSDKISELNYIFRCDNMDGIATSSIAADPDTDDVNANASVNQSDNHSANYAANGNEEEECVTPTSSPHRIPEFPISTCPAAPMKPKPSKRLPPFLCPPAAANHNSMIRSVKRRIDFVNPPLITSGFFVPTAADLHNSPDCIKSLFAN